jgi:hypothetical protein
MQPGEVVVDLASGAGFAKIWTLARERQGSQKTRRRRKKDSNPRPFTRNSAFLRLSEPRLQPICTPIVHQFAPLANPLVGRDRAGTVRASLFRHRHEVPEFLRFVSLTPLSGLDRLLRRPG